MNGSGGAAAIATGCVAGRELCRVGVDRVGLLPRYDQAWGVPTQRPHGVPAALFQMPVRVLPTMQDTDDLNVSGSHAVKQDVALQGEAPAVR